MIDSKIQQAQEKQLERQKMEKEMEKNATLLLKQQKLLRINNFTGYLDLLHIFNMYIL